MNYTYLLVNLGSLLVPLAFTFHPRLRFYREWNAFWPALLITSTIFIAWDILYTRWEVWTFNHEHLMGIFLLDLPLEEWLFFLCIPYACVFTWHCFAVIWNTRDKLRNMETAITVSLILILSAGVLFYHHKLYTFVICLFLMIALLIIKYYFNVKWLGGFYLTYLFLLVPTILVNGFISGLGLEEPIVWYNESHIINLRLLTIPVEDLLYGMLLILLNICLFEFFKRRYGKG